jgi:tellurite resistance protein TehA-like permease
MLLLCGNNRSRQRLARSVISINPNAGLVKASCCFAVWFMLLLLYISKWLSARKATLAEFGHPILCCFTALVPVSTVMVAVAIAPYAHALAVALFVVGAIGQLSFGVYRSGQIWMGV